MKMKFLLVGGCIGKYYSISPKLIITGSIYVTGKVVFISMFVFVGWILES